MTQRHHNEMWKHYMIADMIGVTSTLLQPGDAHPRYPMGVLKVLDRVFLEYLCFLHVF